MRFFLVERFRAYYTRQSPCSSRGWEILRAFKELTKISASDKQWAKLKVEQCQIYCSILWLLLLYETDFADGSSLTPTCRHSATSDSEWLSPNQQNCKTRNEWISSKSLPEFLLKAHSNPSLLLIWLFSLVCLVFKTDQLSSSLYSHYQWTSYPAL